MFACFIDRIVFILGYFCFDRCYFFLLNDSFVQWRCRRPHLDDTAIGDHPQHFCVCCFHFFYYYYFTLGMVFVVSDDHFLFLMSFCTVAVQTTTFRWLRHRRLSTTFFCMLFLRVCLLFRVVFILGFVFLMMFCTVAVQATTFRWHRHRRPSPIFFACWLHVFVCF